MSASTRTTARSNMSRFASLGTTPAGPAPSVETRA